MATGHKGMLLVPQHPGSRAKPLFIIMTRQTQLIIEYRDHSGDNTEPGNRVSTPYKMCLNEDKHVAGKM